MKTLEAAVRPSIAHEKFEFKKLHGETFRRCSLQHGLRCDPVRLVFSEVSVGKTFDSVLVSVTFSTESKPS